MIERKNIYVLSSSLFDQNDDDKKGRIKMMMMENKMPKWNGYIPITTAAAVAIIFWFYDYHHHHDEYFEWGEEKICFHSSTVIVLFIYSLNWFVFVLFSSFNNHNKKKYVLFWLFICCFTNIHESYLSDEPCLLLLFCLFKIL